MRREDVILKSYIILENFISRIDVKKYTKAFVYLNFRNEPISGGIIHYLLEHTLTVSAPRIDRTDNLMRPCIITDAIDDLAVDPFGFRTPSAHAPTADPSSIDLVIAPGVAFDETGNRIGFGRGYYDTFFRGNAKALRVALAYDFQVLRELPVTPRDEKIDMIITETRILTPYARTSL
ncbi:MAG: 5-formyltetrahydrofolate cyclo-ligase [Spirochaetota bacterium]